jgi:hypothetical protein
MYEKGIALRQGISATASSPQHELGDRIHVGDSQYVYCYNAGVNSAIAMNVGLDWVGSFTGIYSMSCSGAVSGTLYKVINKNCTVPTGHYFWGLTRGPVTITRASGVTGAGAPVFAASGATGAIQTASGLTGVITAIGAAGEYGAANAFALGVVMSATTASEGSASVFFYGKHL